ncbi:MAG: Ig-like domain-containing protein [Betaproteobacteria bacterium]
MKSPPSFCCLCLFAAAWAHGEPCVPDDELAKEARNTDPRVRIVSPPSGQVFYDAQPIDIVIELAAPLTAQNSVGVTLSGLGHLDAEWTGGLQFSASISLPRGFVSGPIVMSPNFFDSSGRYFAGAPRVVAMKSSARPENVRLHERTVVMSRPGSDSALYLEATYADGSKADVSSCLLGTTYSTSDPSVARVSSNGVVRGLAPGIATITARHGDFADVASVVLEDETKPLPPIDLTDRVTISRSALRLDPNPRLYPQGDARLYLQDLVIVNSSTEALGAPLYLVFADMPEGVLVRSVGRAGTHSLPPGGSQYMWIDLRDEGVTMRPGSRVAVTLQLDNPGGGPIHYSLRLYRTSASP